MAKNDSGPSSQTTNPEKSEAPVYAIKALEHGYTWGSASVPVLKGVDLQVPTRSFTCLVGPSGSGKTTLLNLMGLLDRPLGGSIFFFGRDVSAADESEREELRLKDLGFVFQSFHLLPTLSVLENTIYFLPMLGFSPADAKRRGEEVLERIGLKDQRDRRPGELSGGQRQRVAIARALAKRPKVILADEPTANLDAATSETIIAVFKELQKAESTSFVFSTHDDRLVSYADRIFELRNGQLASREETP